MVVWGGQDDYLNWDFIVGLVLLALAGAVGGGLVWLALHWS